MYRWMIGSLVGAKLFIPLSDIAMMNSLGNDSSLAEKKPSRELDEGADPFLTQVQKKVPESKEKGSGAKEQQSTTELSDKSTESKAKAGSDLEPPTELDTILQAGALSKSTGEPEKLQRKSKSEGVVPGEAFWTEVNINGAPRSIMVKVKQVTIIEKVGDKNITSSNKKDAAPEASIKGNITPGKEDRKSESKDSTKTKSETTTTTKLEKDNATKAKPDSTDKNDKKTEGKDDNKAQKKSETKIGKGREQEGGKGEEHKSTNGKERKEENKSEGKGEKKSTTSTETQATSTSVNPIETTGNFPFIKINLPKFSSDSVSAATQSGTAISTKSKATKKSDSTVKSTITASIAKTPSVVSQHTLTTSSMKREKTSTDKNAAVTSNPHSHHSSTTAASVASSTDYFARIFNNNSTSKSKTVSASQTSAGKHKHDAGHSAHTTTAKEEKGVEVVSDSKKGVFKSVVVSVPLGSSTSSSTTKMNNSNPQTAKESTQKPSTQSNKGDPIALGNLFDILKNMPDSSKDPANSAFLEGQFSFPKEPKLKKKVFKISGYVSG